MTMPSIRYDLTKLSNFVKQYNENKRIVRIGIMGQKASKVHDSITGLTNAEIGTVHEYGSFKRNIPQRSFLWMPLFMKTAYIIKETKKICAADILNGDFKKVMVSIGIICEEVIQNAFDTGGFGKWEQHKNKYIKTPLLWVSAQLRRSVASVVVEKK